ncbi:MULTISPECIES: hypothetical protein [unclassified Mesorhizobium]|uniref:hypothetical protein n=1 Tax=unclassified Mesorhizobium TaxID=325217 RepID=UPI000FE4A4E5|nr:MULTISPECIES: hypothetical protein [unclassified Mesorhizobium]RWB92864.1 MAG: hypothetical protein EOQ57_35580 [Mesorhizobium sp.]TGV22175.1 hypothetical protein EN786_31120 [Mesorhizobium sp. M4B.F.Ca.ET.143.01.1.1]
MKTVACVLRSGGEYAPRHVVRLLDQVTEHLPGAKFRCFSDVDLQGIDVIPLRHEWPGWWAKMELFRPELQGDWLFFDLDTSIIGSLADMAAVEGPVIMRDVVQPWRLQSSIMAIPQSIKAAVWGAFTASPADHMRRFAFDGDQAFLESCRRVDWRLWQDICLGQLCSYKADVQRLGRVPAGVRAVVFHGKPRPWEVGW